MRISLVHNARAGSGEVSRKQLVRAIESCGHEVVEEGEVVVAAGGDGTVAEAAESLIGTSRPLVIVPVGTANNLARGMGQTPARDPIAQLVSVLLDHDERGLDVGTVDEKQHFYESAGTGLFAEALERVFTEEDKQPDRAALALAAFLEQHRAQRFDVRIDQVDVSGEYTMIEVMNVAMLGPNLRLSRNADPFDGLLDVALITENDVARLHAYLVDKGRGGSPSAPAFDVTRARRIEIGLGEAQLRVDGNIPKEAAIGRRVSIGILPSTVRVWVPRSASRHSSSSARTGR